MKRHLMTLILSGFVGAMVLVGNAEACHKKKCPCPAPAPCATVVAAPAPCPAPCPAPVVCQPVCAPRAKKCGGGAGLFSHFKGLKFGHHRRGCAPAPVCETVVYAAPVAATPQASAQH